MQVHLVYRLLEPLETEVLKRVQEVLFDGSLTDQEEDENLSAQPEKRQRRSHGRRKMNHVANKRYVKKIMDRQSVNKGMFIW